MLTRHHWAFLLGLTCWLMMVGGCGALQSPIITPEGQIQGGRPKLNKMMHLLDALAGDTRDEVAAEELRLIAYIGSDRLQDAQVYEGVLPTGTRFSIYFDTVGLDASRNAVVVATLSTEESVQAQIFRWQDGRWHRVAVRPFRIGVERDGD